MTMRNVDNTLVKVEQQKLNKDVPQENVSQTEDVAPDPVIEEAAQPAIKAEETPQETQEIAEEQQKGEVKAKSEEKANDAHVIDEYGNPVEKERLYTEKEVQTMMRERLSRGQYGRQQPTQQEVAQVSKDFTPDPNSNDSWEQQLNQFIDARLETRQKQITERQWKEQELRRQEEFQDKFTTGMSKYKDFQDVVAGKPISDSMMLATRGMSDPAAFIYAASKTQPKELERIAQIPDPLLQATEMGKLEERMRKARTTVSKAGKPANPIRGDMAVKQHDQPSIDQRIAQHATKKMTRR